MSPLKCMDPAAQAHLNAQTQRFTHHSDNATTAAEGIDWILPPKAAQADRAQRLTHRHSGWSLREASMTAPRHSHDSSRKQQGNHAKRNETAPEPKNRTGTAKRTPHRVTHGYSEFSKGRNMRRTSTGKMFSSLLLLLISAASRQKLKPTNSKTLPTHGHSGFESSCPSPFTGTAD